mmetsp:Transcript_88332/g.230196  ORF Transcript_88332/g.230196 Transcript_88332/m.230196 type:complete len:231 (-) Transcript_88332:56-748(-)
MFALSAHGAAPGTACWSRSCTATPLGCSSPAPTRRPPGLPRAAGRWRTSSWCPLSAAPTSRRSSQSCRCPCWRCRRRPSRTPSRRCRRFTRRSRARRRRSRAGPRAAGRWSPPARRPPWTCSHGASGSSSPACSWPPRRSAPRAPPTAWAARTAGRTRRCGGAARAPSGGRRWGRRGQGGGVRPRATAWALPRGSGPSGVATAARDCTHFAGVAAGVPACICGVYLASEP